MTYPEIPPLTVGQAVTVDLSNRVEVHGHLLGHLIRTGEVAGVDPTGRFAHVRLDEPVDGMFDLWTPVELVSPLGETQ